LFDLSDLFSLRWIDLFELLLEPEGEREQVTVVGFEFADDMVTFEDSASFIALDKCAKLLMTDRFRYSLLLYFLLDHLNRLLLRHWNLSSHALTKL